MKRKEFMLAQPKDGRTAAVTPSAAARRATLPTLLGLALMALGLLVIAGWLLQVRAMVEIKAGFVAMAFNTALCFALTGLAIAAPLLLPRHVRAVQSGVGLAVFAICALVLVEHVTDRNLHVDWAWLHLWLHDGNVRPGRLAPNTAIGFMLAGVSLMLLQRIHNRGRERLFQVLVFCVLAVGLTGLIGYVLAPDQLFGWARSARMAVHTACAMSVVAVALWTSWQYANQGNATRFFALDEKIGFVSAAILCVVALAAGLTGFVFQQAELESSLRDKLQFRLEGQMSLIQAALAQTRAVAERARDDAHLLDAAWLLARRPDDAAALARLAPELSRLVQGGLVSAALLGLDGRPLLQLGAAAERAPPSVSLALPSRPGEQVGLAWNGAVLLHTSQPLQRQGVPFARLELKQRLPFVQSQLFDLRGLGQSGEIVLCEARGNQLVCLPSGRLRRGYQLGRSNSVGQPLPMSRAVDGGAGLIAAVDYKGHNVMAAFAPLAPNIGMVVKQDTTELYAVIRTQLTYLTPALLLLLVLGTALMRSQIKPLVARLIASETHARAQQLELLRSEQQVRAAMDEAQQANRAKSAFLANMSHELRTPMNAVLGMAHLLNTTALSLEQQRYLDMIRSSGKSLLGILNDILDFSKIEAGKVELAPAPFDLNDVLHTLSVIMSVNAGDKDLELAIGVEPDVPRLLVADALRLQQVLVNLTGNAIKFTAQGEVSILVECLARDERQATLRFVVRDTGIGISAEQQERLFAPFAQADSSMTRRFGGTGLGLSISKGLVELLGGTIAISSTPGQGSAFSLTLPLPLADELGSARRPDSALGPLRLLLVDDNPTSLSYVSKTIAGWQWEVDCVASGRQALASMRTRLATGSAYDVVLLDWNLPQLDGAAVMQALRAAQPAGPAPVIVMASAYGRSKMFQQGDVAGADAFLTKPVTASSLFDAVHEVISRRDQPGLPALAPSAAPPLAVRLLLVEDNPLNQLVAKGILEQLGACVQVADNGQVALDLLRHDSAAYDLVLMDVQMPVMDGFVATRRIRDELGLSLPVLAMTAGVMSSEREQCLASGMDDFIAKPIEVEQMVAMIRRYAPQAAAVPLPVEK